MGKEVNQQNRASNNVHVANFSEIPTLSGHHKDHKTGRKKRAIVNGNTGPVAPLSNLLSDILKPYCNELKDTIGKTVENTEELLRDFVEYNKSSKCDNGGKKFIGSLDVESLYPSLKVSDCVDIVRETIINSDINIDTVDIKELSIFLRKSFSTKQLIQIGVNDFIPTKVKAPKNVKSVDKDQSKTNVTHALWKFPESQPSKHIKKTMWAEAIVYGVQLIMQNHVYKFDNQIKVQKDGGSIGVTLTGVLSEIKMLKWCHKFRNTCDNIGIQIDLEDRFVDDITLILEETKPGLKLISGQLVHCEDKFKEDIEIKADKRTMDIVQLVANQIDENIKVTYDVPSNYSDGYVPILDVKVSINCDKNIDYIFYKKPMASRNVTHKKSAMSVSQKYIKRTQQTFTGTNPVKIASQNGYCHGISFSTKKKNKERKTEKRKK